MTMSWFSPIAAATISVLAIGIGQLIFKQVAILIHESGLIATPSLILLLALSVSVYGLATILWIWALQTVPLSRAYPILGISFIIVPIGSRIFFGEKLSVGYGIGVLMIIGGIIFISQSTDS